jgi:thioredoxin 1
MKKTTSKTIEEDVSKDIVVVKFWASWCWPCKIVWPIYHEVSEETKWVTFLEFELNDDDSINITDKYWIMSVPTVLIFKDWKVEWTISWIFNKATLINEIKKVWKLEK